MKYWSDQGKRSREDVVFPTTSVEVMELCLNPSWPTDLGKYGTET